VPPGQAVDLERIEQAALDIGVEALARGAFDHLTEQEDPRGAVGECPFPSLVAHIVPRRQGECEIAPYARAIHALFLPRRLAIPIIAIERGRHAEQVRDRNRIPWFTAGMAEIRPDRDIHPCQRAVGNRCAHRQRGE
jgi:hypothetical protein